MFNIENLNDNFFSQLDPNEVLRIKELDTENKIRCFQYFLTSDVISNISVISYIFLLIDGV